MRSDITKMKGIFRCGTRVFFLNQRTQCIIGVWVFLSVEQKHQELVAMPACSLLLILLGLWAGLLQLSPVFVACTCTPGAKTSFRQSSALQDRAPTHGRWTFRGSRALCASLCLRDNLCSAVFHNRENKTCLGFGTTTPQADVMTSSPGVSVLLRHPPGCPVGEGYAFNSSLKLCLKAHLTPVTWQDAKNACEQDGEHLVIIRTWEEELFVRRYLQEMNTGKNISF